MWPFVRGSRHPRPCTHRFFLAIPLGASAVIAWSPATLGAGSSVQAKAAVSDAALTTNPATITKTFCAPFTGQTAHPAGIGVTNAAAPRPAIHAAVDALPGDTDNVVDPRTMRTVPVAILGSQALDARSIDPQTVSLGGAPATKDDDGSIASLVDVDGDGREDLVLLIEARAIPLTDTDTELPVTASRFGGDAIEGSVVLRPFDSLVRMLRAAHARPHRLGKEPVLPVAIDILPSDPSNAMGAPEIRDVPVAILSSEEFDARTVDPTTVTLERARVTRGRRGGLAHYEDVNGDGRPDLIVSIATRLMRLTERSGRLTLQASTNDGRIIEGLDLYTASAELLAVARGAVAPIDSTAPDGTAIGAGPEPQPASFSNPSAITINDATPATPYPSTIAVSGLTGVIAKARVTLHGLSHTCVNDLDILLVGPTGQSFVLMSDVGGCALVVDATLTFDDHSDDALSSAAPAVSGTYPPVNFDSGVDSYPGTAPVQSHSVDLLAFAGTNPNGVWRLYVLDDEAIDSGTIARGWSIDFVMATRACNPAPILVPAGGTSGPASPYPSTIAVAGLAGQVVGKVTATVKGLSHSFTDDLDILLVGPHGESAMLMSDAGGNSTLINVDLTFDGDVQTALSDSGPLSAVSGTYRPTNFDLTDVMPAPAPAGPYGTDMHAFNNADPNGGWNLFVFDDQTADVGAIGGGWCVTITTLPPVQGCQGGAVTIPAGAPGTTVGTAGPYPSTITVERQLGNVFQATATLTGLSHTFPDDLDVLLVNPSGRMSILMSDGGGGTDVVNTTLTFDDRAVAAIPDSAAIGSGSYHPTDYETGETFPAPAPPGPYPALMDYFRGYPANGRWSLFINDDANGDVGSMSGGWCLNLVMYLPQEEGGCSPDPITVPGAGTSGPAATYPSIITVSDSLSTVSKAEIDIFGVNHTFPDDLDILIQGPNGSAVMLMSDAGGSSDLVDADFGFLDGLTLLSDTGPLMGGVYAPTDYEPGDVLPAPAPSSYGTSLGTFAGTDPNGNWKLFVNDDASGDTGNIRFGWCLRLTPVIPVGEVTNLRWEPGSKTSLLWDAAPNDVSYFVFRYIPTELPILLTGSPPTICRIGAATAANQVLNNVNAVPPAGSAFFYLVEAISDGERGSIGFARIDGADVARVPPNFHPCAP